MFVRISDKIWILLRRLQTFDFPELIFLVMVEVADIFVILDIWDKRGLHAAQILPVEILEPYVVLNLLAAVLAQPLILSGN